MNSVLHGTVEDLEYLLSPRTIRARAQEIFEHAAQGRTHFALHLDRLPEVAMLVSEVTLAHYPQLDIPYHSRWNHFRVGGVDRNGQLNAHLARLSSNERVKAKLDLVIVSVLLDAGAGTQWQYTERHSGWKGGRSEGLAVASWNMFTEGHFSSRKNEPLCVDAEGLEKLNIETLAHAFQVSEQNPLVGLEGRFSLLKALAKALRKDPELFGASDPRPGALLDYFQAGAIFHHSEVQGVQILRTLQRGLGSIWPGRITLQTPQGVFNLGDVWHYSPLGEKLSRSSLVPFHKLSQWLSYSLIEPLMEAGLHITEVQELTGLAEYRNGGLMLDGGLLQLRNPKLQAQSHQPSSELIIEWRALTIALLDQLAEPVRKRLGDAAKDFPLAKILEGGTWWAGRQLANHQRRDGGSPLKLDSDGTVF